MNAWDIRLLRQLVEGHEIVSEFNSDPASPVALSSSQAAIQIGYVSGGQTLGFVPNGYGRLRQLHLALTSVSGAATATVALAVGATSGTSVIVTDSVTANILANPSGTTWAVNIEFPPSPIWKSDSDFYFALVTLDELAEPGGYAGPLGPAFGVAGLSGFPRY